MQVEVLKRSDKVLVDGALHEIRLIMLTRIDGHPAYMPFMTVMVNLETADPYWLQFHRVKAVAESAYDRAIDRECGKGTLPP